MKTINRWKSIASIGAAAALIGLAVGAAAPARAQDTTQLPTKNVTVTLSNSPVRVALDALFKSVGLNYTIDPAIQQDVTVNLRNVPFDVALRSILRATNPPLQYTIDNGVYRITQQGIDQTATTATVNAPAGPDSGDVTDTSDDSDTTSASDDTANQQVVVLYLRYINGSLLNLVVGPVVDIQPQMYDSAMMGGGMMGGGMGGGMMGGMGGMGGGMMGGGMMGGGMMGGGMGGGMMGGGMMGGGMMGGGMGGGYGGGNMAF